MTSDTNTEYKIHSIDSSLLDLYLEDFIALAKAEKSLKPVHIELYRYILNKMRKRNWKHHHAWDMHMDKIAKDNNISRRTLQRVRQSLTDAGYLAIVKISKNQNECTRISIVTQKIVEYVEDAWRKKHLTA